MCIIGKYKFKLAFVNGRIDSDLSFIGIGIHADFNDCIRCVVSLCRCCFILMYTAHTKIRNSVANTFCLSRDLFACCWFASAPVRDHDRVPFKCASFSLHRVTFDACILLQDAERGESREHAGITCLAHSDSAVVEQCGLWAIKESLSRVLIFLWIVAFRWITIKEHCRILATNSVQMQRWCISIESTSVVFCVRFGKFYCFLLWKN